MSSKCVVALSLLLTLSAPLAAHAEGRVSAPRFEAARSLEVAALGARETVLASERTCVQATRNVGQLHDCRKQAQVARETLAAQLRPQFEALQKASR